MQKLLSLTVPGNNGSVEIEAPEGIPTGGLSGSGGQIIGWLFTLFLIGAIIIALGFTVYGGFLWMSSRGDKSKLESARHTIIFAIFGLIVCFVSFLIIALFGSIFDINLLQISL